MVVHTPEAHVHTHTAEAADGLALVDAILLQSTPDATTAAVRA